MKLVEAARVGDFETALSLCGAGRDVNERDEWGGTALMYAVGACNEVAVLALLQHGADVHIFDDQGRTALDYAIAFSCPDSIVKLLKQHGASTASSNEPVLVRGVEPRDVIAYARSAKPDLAVLASMIRELKKDQAFELVTTAEAADIEIFKRALEQQ